MKKRVQSTERMFLVKEHRELFQDVKHALGEFGGFSMQVAGKRFYPIAVAEKLQCTVQITTHGVAGHGSMPVRDGAMAQMGQILAQLERRPAPIHITPVFRLLIEGLADALGQPRASILRLLLQPNLTRFVLARLGSSLASIQPLFQNTISPHHHSWQ